MRTKATYTVVTFNGDNISTEQGLTIEEASKLLASSRESTTDGFTSYLFKGDPIPFTVETDPRVTIGTPKVRAKRNAITGELTGAKRGRPKGSKNKTNGTLPNEVPTAA